MSLLCLMSSPVLHKVLGQVPRYTRCLTAAADRLFVDMDSKTGVATVKLNHPPVNCLNLEFLTDINILLEKLDNDKSCRGLILTSTSNQVFCAGLDIMELYQPQPDRLEEFLRVLQNVWINLYGSRLVTIAAINGHSIAGGCMLATCCDYRIMVEKFTIGLNETQLGIVAPLWLTDSMEGLIGHRQTDLVCQKGMRLTTEQAFKVGMVDKVVTPEAVLRAAQNEMKSWLKVPDYARELTKIQMKKPTIDKLLARREEDTHSFVSLVTTESVQETLGLYFEQMKSRKK